MCELCERGYKFDMPHELVCAMRAAGLPNVRKLAAMVIHGQTVVPVMAGWDENHLVAAVYETQLGGHPRLAWADRSVGISDASLKFTSMYDSRLEILAPWQALHVFAPDMKLGSPVALARLLAHIYRRIG